MKILIASDSYKGSLTSLEVGTVIKDNLIEDELEIDILEVSDGGEGLIEAFLHYKDAKIYRKVVTGPQFNAVDAKYLYISEKEVAVIEMAEAAGLPKTRGVRNPLLTTTYGVGELIKDALERGVKKIILGIGGSATNDGACGMLEALGVRFYGKDGLLTEMTGEKLGLIDKIDLKELDGRLEDVDIEVACDVTNPLYGEQGAAHVFAPQKGADQSMVKILDENLRHYAEVLDDLCGCNVNNIPGAGAAGGMGAGLSAILKGKLKSGIDLVLDNTDFDSIVKEYDLVITGEGRMDRQSVFGKTPFGVMLHAKRFEKPVVGICGLVRDKEFLLNSGFDQIFEIVPTVATLKDSLDDPVKYLAELVKKNKNEIIGVRTNE